MEITIIMALSPIVRKVKALREEVKEDQLQNGDLLNHMVIRSTKMVLLGTGAHTNIMTERVCM